MVCLKLHHIRDNMFVNFWSRAGHALFSVPAADGPMFQEADRAKTSVLFSRTGVAECVSVVWKGDRAAAASQHVQ